MESTGPAGPSPDEVLQEVAKAGTNVDTIVGRLVIDQGFATPEEVQHCLTLAKQLAEDPNQRSLADLLVQNDYVTLRQMARLREVAQAASLEEVFASVAVDQDVVRIGHELAGVSVSTARL